MGVLFGSLKKDSFLGLIVFFSFFSSWDIHRGYIWLLFGSPLKDSFFVFLLLINLASRQGKVRGENPLPSNYLFFLAG